MPLFQTGSTFVFKGAGGLLLASVVFLGVVCGLKSDDARAQSSRPVATSGSAQPKLKVVTIERQPFAMKSNGKWIGFSIELWREIANELKSDFVLTEAKSFPEMLKRVEDRDVDAAIANITITSQREQTLDFSQPIFDAGLQVMVRSTGSSVGLVGAIFNWEMLGLVVFAGLLLFGVANLMWLFERRSQPYFDLPLQRRHLALVLVGPERHPQWWFRRACSGNPPRSNLRRVPGDREPVCRFGLCRQDHGGPDSR